MAANIGDIFVCDNSMLEEVTVNVNTTTDDHAYSTSSRPMPLPTSTSSNTTVNDSNLGTKQAEVISSGSTSLNL